MNDGNQIEVTAFVERLRLIRGKVALATWANDDPLLKNARQLPQNRVGRGSVIYVGGLPRNPQSCGF